MQAVRLSQELPIVWTRTPFHVSDLLNYGHGCIRTVGDVTEVGAGYIVTLRNTATGEQLFFDYECQWAGDPPPEPPPPPPTAGELAADNGQALTVAPGLSPASNIGGLTGLDSWLWCQDPGPVDANVELRGWSAQGAVEIVQLGWEVDGPSGVVQTTTDCGSEHAPAVTWTPETIGDYSVLLTAVWAGTWDLAWEGIPMGTFPLGPIALAGPVQPYPVDEYHGELAG